MYTHRQKYTCVGSVPCTHTDRNIRVLAQSLVHTQTEIYVCWLSPLYTDRQKYTCVGSVPCTHTDRNIRVLAQSLVHRQTEIYVCWLSPLYTDRQKYTCVGSVPCTHTDRNIRVLAQSLVHRQTEIYVCWLSPLYTDRQKYTCVGSVPCTQTDRRRQGPGEVVNMMIIRIVCLLVGCLTSQQHVSVSEGQISSDMCTCCHTEIEVADQTFCRLQYIDTGPNSPSADPTTPSVRSSI